MKTIGYRKKYVAGNQNMHFGLPIKKGVKKVQSCVRLAHTAEVRDFKLESSNASFDSLQHMNKKKRRD